MVLSLFVPSVIMLLTYCFHIRKSCLFVFKPVLSFTLMSAVAAMVFQSVLIVIRSLLVEHSGVEIASYWVGIVDYLSL